MATSEDSLQRAELLEGRLETTIHFRIAEAKGLPPPDLRSTRDSYVVVALDQEEMYRTAVVEKNNSPLYGEEYMFQLPREFRNLSFYVCDAGGIRDTRIGKVAISKELLVKDGITEDTWIPIRAIDADTEVQGSAHLEINVYEHLAHYVLTIRVLECHELSSFGTTGLPDPYCQVSVLMSGRKEWSDPKRSQVKKKTTDPSFTEIFEYTFRSFEELTSVFIKVAFYHGGRVGDNPFLGEINLSMAEITMSRSHNAWYQLCSRRESESRSNSSDLGSLRIKAVLLEDFIHPLSSYELLSSALLESLEVENLVDSALFILSEAHKNRTEMGKAIVKIFLKSNKIDGLMKAIIEHEVKVTSDPNTLFRGNSLASKVIDEFMKLVGQEYLQRTLQCCIDEIFDSKRNCEIDPSKLTDADHLDVNMANLLFFVEKILSAITASALSCPRSMCRVFALLKDIAVSHFPDDGDSVQYTAVSAFVFLRFFAPAILNPKLLNLRREFACPVVARTLTLISKTIQGIGNIGAMKQKGASMVRKEVFMTNIYEQIMDASHIRSVKEYLTAISDPQGGKESSFDITVYREGYLVKRSQRKKMIVTPKNFRKRYFCLTDKRLYYAKGKPDVPLCTIRVEDILGVEQVDDDTFNMKFMFQVIQKDRILYVQAKNAVDLMEWLSAISKSCPMPPPDTFHNGAYLNNSWTCCGSADEKAAGCKPVSLYVKMLGKKEVIDLPVELHKVYRMLLQCQAKLMDFKRDASEIARSSMVADDSTSTDAEGHNPGLHPNSMLAEGHSPGLRPNSMLAEGHSPGLRPNSMLAESHSPGLYPTSAEDLSPGLRPKSMFSRGTHTMTVDGTKSDLPVRLKAVCSLLVFVKNMEVSSDINIGRNTLKPGSSSEAPFRCQQGEAYLVQ
ncbi:hypothetical protein EMCRGX_G026236 [Ephydatia muelleri]